MYETYSAEWDCKSPNKAESTATSMAQTAVMIVNKVAKNCIMKDLFCDGYWFE